jgi:formylglycine-generating enzyme required for sulfatase activity
MHPEASPSSSPEQNVIRPEQIIACRVLGLGGAEMHARIKEIQPDLLKLSSSDNLPKDIRVRLEFDVPKYRIRTKLEGLIVKSRNNPSVRKCYATVQYALTSVAAGQKLFQQVAAAVRQEQRKLAETKYLEAVQFQKKGKVKQMLAAVLEAKAADPTNPEILALEARAIRLNRRHRMAVVALAGIAVAVLLTTAANLYVKRHRRLAAYEQAMRLAEDALKENEHMLAHQYVNAALRHHPKSFKAVVFRKQLVPVPFANDFGFSSESRDVYDNRIRKTYDKETGHPWEIQHKATGTLFVLIPPGTLWMGSTEAEEGHKADEKLHSVTLSQPFYMSKYETTVGLFRRFAEETGYKTTAEEKAVGFVRTEKGFEVRPDVSWRSPGYDQTDDHPAVLVSWNDAQRFLEWLNKGKGTLFRLPTEAQWEHACRAKTQRPFFWGNLPEHASSYANVLDQTAGMFFRDMRSATSDDRYIHAAPMRGAVENNFALYHILGNALEWCSDWYGSATYKVEGQIDPIGPPQGTHRVLRGGSWARPIDEARCASRHYADPDYRSNDTGFRAIAIAPAE